MSTCKTCGASIRWAKTKRGKKMPIDPAPVAGGNLVLSADGSTVEVVPGSPTVGRLVSHWVTCTNPPPRKG